MRACVRAFRGKGHSTGIINHSLFFSFLLATKISAFYSSLSEIPCDKSAIETALTGDDAFQYSLTIYAHVSFPTFINL